MQMASAASIDTFVRQTPSIEYWDDMPPQSKIRSMATYLQDVRQQRNFSGAELTNNVVPDLTHFRATRECEFRSQLHDSHN